MNKGTTTAQILEVAARSREHGIIPEFSFVFGDPHDPERRDRQHARVRAPAQGRESGDGADHLLLHADAAAARHLWRRRCAARERPTTLEEWTQPEWVAWMTHEDPRVPWLDRTLKARVEDFELVLKSRFPSVHDRGRRRGARRSAVARAAPLGERASYDDPSMLRPCAGWPARAGRLAGLRPSARGEGMMALTAREAYRLWAPHYEGETAVSLLRGCHGRALGVPVRGRALLDAAAAPDAVCATAVRRSASASISVRRCCTTRRDQAMPAAGDVRALPFAASRSTSCGAGS